MQVLQAVNGAVVGLTRAASGSGSKTAAVSECLGVGVVRSVNAAEQMLYILTPTPEELLPEVTMLEVRLDHVLRLDHQFDMKISSLFGSA